MRIVAGEWGGRRLVAPKGRGVRPTLERVREAVFDTLGTRPRGARVLDLFAGSGAMGFEALSRGADRATWCDASERAIAAIRENAAKLAVPPARAAILHMPAGAAIERLAKAGESFDIVFVDPPWESGLYEETLLALSLSRIVAPGGMVVVEHAVRFDVSAVFGDLLADRERRYGDSGVTYFKRGGR
ncbi:MAG: 16S rRNA (guanine(966)-N(2))-methyltransferase RsmD [Deltaproteobacteria bacterium]|nr:16S rRNA (guanine(966)-N(2))-methyltransferase RsmD [Deltaproteobacteria bacterium]